MGKLKRKTTKSQNRHKANHNLKTRRKTRRKTRTRAKSRMKTKRKTRRKTKMKQKKKTSTRAKKMKVMMGGYQIDKFVSNEVLIQKLNKAGEWVVTEAKEGGPYTLAVALDSRKRLQVQIYSIFKLIMKDFGGEDKITFRITKIHPDRKNGENSKLDYTSGDIQDYISNLKSGKEVYLNKRLVLKENVSQPAVPPRSAKPALQRPPPQPPRTLAPSRPPLVSSNYEHPPPAFVKCGYIKFDDDDDEAIFARPLRCPNMVTPKERFCQRHKCPECGEVKTSAQLKCDNCLNYAELVFPPKVMPQQRQQFGDRQSETTYAELQQSLPRPPPGFRGG